MSQLTLQALAGRYREGLTPTAFVRELAAKIDAQGDAAIWIRRLTLDELLAHARRVESRPRAEQPLYGIPFAIKDNIDLAGVPTTAGCPGYSYIPAASAPVVARLLALGAIPVGKTNLDQFATGLVGTRSPYGVPRNPFNPAMIPGGSSSGSAIAVAAGLASFSLGTDTAGSGRIPAGFNNLVGLKPTRGALSTRGVVPACRSLDCVSLFTLNAADAGEIARLVEAYDADDPLSRPRPPGTSTPIRRIGVPAARDLEFFSDAEAPRIFEGAQRRLTELGFELVEIDFAPFRETAALLYQGPWVAERWTALRAFHATNADAILPLTRKILEGASQLTAADAFAGQYQLASLRRRAEAEWTRMDALLVPTAPRPYTVREVEQEPLLLNTRLGTYTNFVNLLDLAAIALPAGLRSDRLPSGITFIAPAWSEPSLLALASRWEGGGCKTPALQASAESAASPVGLVSCTSRPSVLLAVVGAHLTGQPLNKQLTERGAHLVRATTTTPEYRLYALPGTTPPKPGLIRVGPGGVSIAVEIWEMPTAHFGSFVAGIPAPLGIGTLAVQDRPPVLGFLCESIAIAGAKDISEFGGWREYLRHS